MSWYLRKSFRVGPVRLNLSKSGFGVSAGIRGLRLGVRPNGRTYVHAGRYGLYARTELGRLGGADGTASPEAPFRDSALEGITNFDTASASDLVPESREDFLSQLNDCVRRQPLTTPMVVGVLALCIASLWTHWTVTAAILLAGAAGTVGVAIWSRRRRNLTLLYTLSDIERLAFGRLVDAVNELAGCSRLWALVTSQSLHTRRESKLHGGASSLVDRSAAGVGEASPPCIETNLSIPVLHAREQALYFLPDGILVYEARRVGFVEYTDLHLRTGTVRFIEPAVPPDATVVDQTWKHPNKSGGPDRRFKDNYQIPVCLYGELDIRSTSGLFYKIQTSRPESPDGFALAFQSMLDLLRTPMKLKYSVLGDDLESGFQTTLTVEAASREEAIAIAQARGVMVKQVVPRVSRTPR